MPKRFFAEAYEECINFWQSFKTLQLQIVFTLILLPVADFLVFQKEGIGITLAIFLVALGGSVYLIQSRLKIEKKHLIGVVFILLGVLPMFEVATTLTMTLALLSTFTAIMYMDSRKLLRPPLAFVWQSILLCLKAPFRFVYSFQFFGRIGKQKIFHAVFPILKNWVLPLGMGLFFLAMFVLANPIFENWFSEIDLSFLDFLLDWQRLLFLISMAVICWTLLRIRVKNRYKPELVSQENPAAERPKFNSGQVIRSLVLFNLLFAAQTMMDLNFIWFDGELPEDVSHSQYVHRGTYILLITAILAAVFILFVTSSKMQMEKNRRIRLLLLAWTAQNMMLVLSTMMRLSDYVEAYALTYLRVAAFVWMLLVMIGLGLIVVRLLSVRDNQWLIKANTIAAIIVVYAVSIANMPLIIGNYNVSVAIENREKELDIWYLVKLGEFALPAMHRAHAKKVSAMYIYRDRKTDDGQWLQGKIKLLEKRVLSGNDNWREWSFRRFRLNSYLANLRKKIHDDADVYSRHMCLNEVPPCQKY